MFGTNLNRTNGKLFWLYSQKFAKMVFLVYAMERHIKKCSLIPWGYKLEVQTGLVV